jgi:hypothetical protein
MSDKTWIEKTLDLQYSSKDLHQGKYLLEMSLHPSTRCVSHFSNSLDELFAIVHTQLKSKEASPRVIYKLGDPPTIAFDCMAIRDKIAELFGTYYKV